MKTTTTIRKTNWTFGVMVLVAAFGLLGMANPTEANAQACGDTISSDTVLTGDLDCSGNANGNMA